MPRQVRIEYAGATYHVMARGDRREAIFEDDGDREIFLATLAQAGKRSGWRVLAYVLMGNHYHLVVETPEANLVKGMTWLQTTYTTRYNARHRQNGHVFGGRYKALVVDSEERSYLSTLINYVHLNPARAGLTGGRGPGLLEYRWSSLPGYVFPGRRGDLLSVERGLSALGYGDTSEGRAQLARDLESRARQERTENELEASLQATLRRGWYFGREAFREWLLAQSRQVLAKRSEGGQNYHGPELSDHGENRAREIIDTYLLEANLDRTALARLKKSDPFKVEMAQAVRKETNVSLQWLAKELFMGTSMNVSRLTAPSLR